MDLSARKARKALSADSLFRLVRARFDRLADPRAAAIPLGDALMPAFAMFSLKDPSLLAFDERRRDPNDNFRTLYGIDHVPCDSQMRSILDPVDPADLRPAFQDVFRRLQRGKALEPFVYLEGHYLLSLDGTTYFSSTKVHCPACLEKHHRGGGVTYSHQLLGATLVHPDRKEVIPLAPEPIVNADGHTKNDCERNATRRWLQQFRRDHPHLPVIIVEDALNESHPDCLVNVLEYWEVHPNGKIQYFSWITDFVLTPDNVDAIMRGGRARWKIENETFNTLKNHGYNLEHNYGHGEQNLSVVLALLMLLVFLVDQTQQLCCPLFQAAWKKLGTKRHLWETIRIHFAAFLYDSMTALLTALVRGIARQQPVLQNSS